MRAYRQNTQDAADELMLFADNTESLYALRLKRQARLRDTLKANPAAPYGTVTYVIYAHYALSRYIAEVGHKPAGWSPAAINCFAQSAEEQDRDELKYEPTAFDWITPEAIAKHEQSR